MELADTGAEVVVMTSSIGSENSVEGPEWGYDKFPKTFLEDPAGDADIDSDGVISFKKLDLYVTYGVKKLTDTKQCPTTQIPSNMPDFQIYVQQQKK